MPPSDKRPAEAPERRRYEAPRVLFRERIEALAGTCEIDGGGKGFPPCTVPGS